jgi:hypothetical protein
MNRLLATLAGLGLLLPSLAAAGEIFGTVTGDAGPAPEGTAVEASCKLGKHGPAKTDKAGKYRLVISETGKCTLTVTRGSESASVSVVSFDDAAQVDLVLAKDAAGALTVRRK